MSKITTEDCKNFLVSKYQKTLAKDWKRLSKYNQDDIVYRNFNHPQIGEILIAENDGKLSTNILTSKTKSPDMTNNFIQKVFSKDNTKGAKTLLANYLEPRINKNNKNNNSQDELMKTSDWTNYYHAIPSQFNFCFPQDTYSNEIENVKNGLDSIFQFEAYRQSSSFNVIFENKNNDDMDLYANDILTKGILPDWTSFVDEYHLEAMVSSPKDLTVKGFISLLLDLGFTYKDDDCLFSKEMKTVSIKKVEPKIDTKENYLKDVAKLKDIFKTDNDKQLQQMLNKGLDVNLDMPDNKTPIILAYAEKSTKCISLLLQNNASLWLENLDNNRTVASSIINESQHLESSFLIEVKKENNNKDNFLEKNKRLLHSILCNKNAKEILPQYISNFETMFSVSEFNEILLTNLSPILKLDKNLALEIVLNAPEQKLKSFVVENFYPNDFTLWILENKPLDFNGFLIKNKPVKDYIKDEMNSLLKSINSPFDLRMTSINGTTVSQKQLDQKKIQQYTELYRAVLNGETKSKPKI